MEQKLNEENIEHNHAFVLYRPSKIICNQINTKICFFEIRHIRTKYVCFLFRLNFNFDFFIKKHDETDCVSEQFCKKEWIYIAISEAVCLLNSPLLERSEV